MPELPEVENTRLGIVDQLQGAQLLSVKLGKPLRFGLGCKPSAIKPQRIHTISRRGKYLCWRLDYGEMIVHLGMSGALLWADEHTQKNIHDHVIWCTNRGELRLRDPRRFGAVIWHQAETLHPLLAHLGVEPLTDSFNAEYLIKHCSGRERAIKDLIMEQGVVVGVGNIYACEALFAARIHPLTPSKKLKPQALKLLVQAIKSILKEAIMQGGSSLRDYLQPHGSEGYFQKKAKVYDRAGLVCMNCNQACIQVMRQGQRSSYFCPYCQK